MANIASDGPTAPETWKPRNAVDCRRQAEQCFELARNAIADIDASLMSRLGDAFLDAARRMETQVDAAPAAE